MEREKGKRSFLCNDSLHGEGEEKVPRERKSRRRRKSPEIQELTPEGAVPDGGDSEESDPGRFVINRAEPLTAEETEDRNRKIC